MEMILSIDFQKQAEAALYGFMRKLPERLPGKEEYYQTYFGNRLLPQIVFRHADWDWGDCTGRAIEAWLYLREMTGDSKTGIKVESGQRRLLLSILHRQTGLVFVPERSDIKANKYYYHMWDQGRTLRALVRWYIASPNNREMLKPYIEKMMNGLDQYAKIRGRNEFGEYAGFASDEFINEVPGPAVGFVNQRAGMVIEPLAMYASFTGDPEALRLAIIFANCTIGGHEAESLDEPRFGRNGSKHDFQFGPDGSFTGHFHTRAANILGIVKLAQLLYKRDEKARALQYLRFAGRVYDWIFAEHNPNRGSRIGWFPENMGDNRSSRVICETCCGADMIELTVELAKCSVLIPELVNWSNLWDDVEAMTVNTMAQSQLRLTALAAAYKKLFAKPYDIELASKLESAWAAAFYPNDLVLSEPNDSPFIHEIGGCCIYSGVRGLYAGWKDSMQMEEGALRVNYFINRASKWATVFSLIPREGRVRIQLKQETQLLIRVPNWLAKKKIRISVNGHVVRQRLDASKYYLMMGKLPGGAEVELSFPLEERITYERIGGNNQGSGFCPPDQKIQYTIDWRGNYIMSVEPHGRYLPLFAHKWKEARR